MTKYYCSINYGTPQWGFSGEEVELSSARNGQPPTGGARAETTRRADNTKFVFFFCSTGCAERRLPECSYAEHCQK